jgi:hypothetical protein
MTRLVKCYNMRFKTGVKICFLGKLQAFEVGCSLFSVTITRWFWEISINLFYDMVLLMGANGASGQELQIEPKK